MAGYRATPMQFQFLAVSGRAAGDASIRDQPPVKSCASLRLTPKRNPVVSSLSLSIRLTLSPYIYISLYLCALSSVSWSSSALFPPLFPSAVNRSPNSPASLFSGEHRLTPPSPLLLLPPPFTVLMRQMRGVPSFAFWRAGPVLFRANLTNSVRREEGGGIRRGYLENWKIVILGICLYDTIFWDKGFKIDKIFL